MGNGDNGFELDDLDFLGISEDEAEDKLSNLEQTKEDISPDALEKEDIPNLEGGE